MSNGVIARSRATKQPAPASLRGAQRRSNPLCLLALLFLLPLLSACPPRAAGPGEAIPRGPVFDEPLVLRLALAEGAVEGRVTAGPAGKPVEGAQVTLGPGKVLSGKGGEFRLAAPGPDPVLLSVQLRARGAGGGAARFVLAEQVLAAEIGTGWAFSLVEVSQGGLDAYCRRCHMEQRTRTARWPKCVHASGVPLGKGMNRGGVLLEKGDRVACDSCHGLHQETGFKALLVETDQGGRLCLRCHR